MFQHIAVFMVPDNNLLPAMQTFVAADETNKGKHHNKSSGHTG